ncbi:formamidopyrimidine-DNA glycosylase [Candidatus Kinetoplastibacterium blastocrithidii TCC012E]|uniref:Formamidopyrimidine-DNA glycosylase n=1 Tax=Candidatus Kinetoplastidibacterium blastocrithidiae TCC012E TaxID=1208922 RepID=M1LAM8_9PROT|nr:bifunctional DNA-formamidopyrimidine glycosylase/DNA-(apurinic or apyrimidinic site) lyase [Candidatus Kinetoplastibacterium blastocrithidii]AFZ83447.1 formamidopyrimidine-DNA glucosyllase [Candidatus Kinetoplastibacterium blastocrithidii (ex Strigomonas culicis)]AGF49543.1 formamidopyrimidine-DNA glycosylase [Candidatus Kinetoplastibacterium blastocrithidii TCC012E]
MPELPEIELLKREIGPRIQNKTILKFKIRNHKLRWPILASLPKIITDKNVINCSRRGKYLLFHFEHGVQIIHLGMSGSLQFITNEPPGKHDHIEWTFNDSTILRMNDPRRFGAILWHDIKNDGTLYDNKIFKNLGLEPFSRKLTEQYLYNKLSNKKKSIKQILLDGNIVVGIGNIYSSESLFKSKINPLISASKLSISDCAKLILCIRETLCNSIKSGGSTIRNYVSTSGQSGNYIKNHASVYGRNELPCNVCGFKIIKIKQSGRSTYYCPNCQNVDKKIT